MNKLLIVCAVILMSVSSSFAIWPFTKDKGTTYTEVTNYANYIVYNEITSSNIVYTLTNLPERVVKILTFDTVDKKRISVLIGENINLQTVLPILFNVLTTIPILRSFLFKNLSKFA